MVKVSRTVRRKVNKWNRELQEYSLLIDDELNHEQASRLANMESQRLYNQGVRGKLYVSIEITDGQWRSNKPVNNVGEEVVLFSPDYYGDDGFNEDTGISEIKFIIVS